MSTRQLRKDTVTDPEERPFEVSTIITYNFDGCSPWPYETMVFREGSRIGLYHAPYATEAEALKGHDLMVETVKRGLEFGGGVEGPHGNPSMTIEQWESRKGASAS